jgi:predicted phage terminase large subunit-like protein
MIAPRIFPLYAPQVQFVNSQKPFIGFVGGIGTGKTKILCYRRLRRLRRNGLYMMAAPSYPMLRDATLRSFAEVAEQLGMSYRFHKTEMIATFPKTGAEILFRSADDPERMRGPNLNEVDLDEASLMPDSTFDIAIGRLRKDGEMGSLAAAFTPKGEYHWTFERFGQDRDDTELVRAKTDDNPFLSPEFIERLRSQYSPLVARQELDGEFLNIEGAEWPADWFKEDIWFDAWPSPDQVTLRTVGVDSSMGRRADRGDYSAIVFLERTRDGTLWIEADVERRPITKVVSDGIALTRRWHRETGGLLDGFGVESDVFQALVAAEFERQSKEAGIMLPIYEMLTGGVDKMVRIRRLTPYLSRGNFRFRNTPGTQMLVRQLREFPVGEYDDGPDGLEQTLRLAVEISHQRTQ